MTTKSLSRLAVVAVVALTVPSLAACGRKAEPLVVPAGAAPAESNPLAMPVGPSAQPAAAPKPAAPSEPSNSFLRPNGRFLLDPLL